MEPIHLLGGFVDGILLRGVECKEPVCEALGGTDDGIELGGTDEFVVTIFPELCLTPIAIVIKNVFTFMLLLFLAMMHKGNHKVPI